MANTAAQFGFQQTGYGPGNAPDFALSKRAIQSSCTTSFFFGDPVVKSASSPYILPGSGIGTTTPVIGIFQGATYVPKGQTAPVWTPWFPGSTQTDATAYIMDPPGGEFRVAALNTAIPATAIGAGIGWSTGAGGTTVGQGFSTFTVDFATIATTNTLPFIIVDMWSNRSGTTGNGVDNANPFNWIVVAPNNQWRHAGATTVL